MDNEGDRRQRRCTAVQMKGFRPAWFCLVPVVALWLVVQEGTPLHPSLGLAEVRVRLLLAAGWFLAVGLGILFLRFTDLSAKPKENQGEVFSSTCSHRVMTSASVRNTQTSRPEGRAVGSPVPVVQAVTDCLVLSLLHEPRHTSATFDVLPLISRLEGLSKALQKADVLWDPALQEKHGEKESKKDAVGERIKHINTYLEERAEALRCLQRLQAEFEACVRDTQAQLQKRWGQLEELHVKVTLSPEQTGGLPDAGETLRDTQCLFSELDSSKSGVHQCQTHLAANSKILKELDHSWLELSRSVNSQLLQSPWTSELLQSNNDKFNDVLQSLTSLEQQTSTFVTHLKGLEKAVTSDNEQISNSHGLTNGSQHVDCSTQDPTSQSSITEEKPSKHLFRVRSGGLCGLRKKRK